jgi:hypothetical protein
MRNFYATRKGMSSVSPYVNATTYPEELGTAAALEESKPVVGQILSQAGRYVPGLAADLLGGAGIGAGAYDTYNNLRKGNYIHAAASGAGAIGGLAALFTASPEMAATALALGIPSLAYGMQNYQSTHPIPPVASREQWPQSQASQPVK